MANIDYVSAHDFTKGFQSFHVTWSIKGFSQKCSAPFKTDIKYDGKVLSLFWKLGISTCDGEPERIWFGLELETSDMAVPVNFRLHLSSAITKESLNDSLFCVFGPRKACGWGLSSEQVAKFLEGNVIFQCWIDIPCTVVVDSNSRKRKYEADNDAIPEFKKKNADTFLSDIGCEFSAVVNGEDNFSDITLIVSGDDKLRRFPCHRILLSAASPVFKVCFAEKGWKENSENGNRFIEIFDIDGETMEIVLNYVYSAHLPDPSTTADLLSKVIYAADKYGLFMLKNWCSLIFITKHTDVLDRIRQLEIADRHSLGQLKAVCISHLSLDAGALGQENRLGNIPDRLLAEIFAAVDLRDRETIEIDLRVK